MNHEVKALSTLALATICEQILHRLLHPKSCTFAHRPLIGRCLLQRHYETISNNRICVCRVTSSSGRSEIMSDRPTWSSSAVTPLGDSMSKLAKLSHDLLNSSRVSPYNRGIICASTQMQELSSPQKSVCHNRAKQPEAGGVSRRARTSCIYYHSYLRLSI
jgi:hypothetical protein